MLHLHFPRALCSDITHTKQTHNSKSEDHIFILKTKKAIFLLLLPSCKLCKFKFNKIFKHGNGYCSKTHPLAPSRGCDVQLQTFSKRVFSLHRFFQSYHRPSHMRWTVSLGTSRTVKRTTAPNAGPRQSCTLAAAVGRCPILLFARAFTEWDPDAWVWPYWGQSGRFI